MKKIFHRQMQSAFSLVEVMLAIGLIVFCFFAIFGLLDEGLESEKDTIGQTASADVLSAVFSDLVSTPTTNSATSIFQISLTNQSFATPQTIYFSEAAVQTGTNGAPPTADSIYRVSIGVQAPTNDMPAPTLVRILITWPAWADSHPNQWPTKGIRTMEVVTALDRN